MDMNDYNENDPERHKKRLNKVMGVSQAIVSMATKKRDSMKIFSPEEILEEILVSLLRFYLIRHMKFKISLILEICQRRTTV